MTTTLLHLEIETIEPFSVAAPEAAVASDRPVALDGDGNVLVPATSLAGSLRAHLDDLGMADQLMGSPRPSEDDDDGSASSSRLRFLGTNTLRGGSPIRKRDLEVRRQTAMDRRRGGAQEHTLRSSQLAPPGAVIHLYARVDGELSPDEVGAIASWPPSVGGGRTHGMGAAVLRSLRLGTIDIGTRHGLATWLRHGGPALVEAVATTSVPIDSAQPTEVCRARFDIVDGLLTAGERVRNTTLIYRRYGEPVIEGSSLKGVLRSRAEWIVASLGVSTCATDALACGGCPTCSLFGSVEQRGRVRVWLSPVRDAVIQTRDHVAIDRITGGASEHRLFSEEVIVAGWFELVVDALGGDVAEWERLLLLWVLRDIHDGYVGIGSRTTRGFGTVALADPSLVADLPPLTDAIEGALR